MRTYAEFLALFVVLPLVLLLGWYIAGRESGGRMRASWLMVGIVAIPAAICWDQQAARWGLWHWERRALMFSRSGWMPWNLPIEEIAFICCLVLLVLLLTARMQTLPPLSWNVRRCADVALVALLSGGLWCGVRAWQLASIPARSHPYYLTYLVFWAFPLVGLQWLVGGSILWRRRAVILLVALSTTLWFTLADSVALHAGLWSFATTDLTGIGLGNVPIEEIVFFFVVTLLVTQTLLVIETRAWATQFHGLWLSVTHSAVALQHLRSRLAFGYYFVRAPAFRRHDLCIASRKELLRGASSTYPMNQLPGAPRSMR